MWYCKNTILLFLIKKTQKCANIYIYNVNENKQNKTKGKNLLINFFTSINIICVYVCVNPH